MVLLTLSILSLMLFATGLISVRKDGYACAGGWDVAFRDRVEVFHYGPLHIYNYPFTRECIEERRYDPDDVQSCIDTGFCTLPEETTSDLSETD